MRKIKWWLAIACTFIVALFGFACTEEAKTPEITGVKNIECSYTVKDYDLLAGVTASNGGKVSVKGEVKFGTAGEYKIAYVCGNTTVNATVKIYGKPVVKTVTDQAASYNKALTGMENVGIEVTDTFGVPLTAMFVGFDSGVSYLRYDTPYTAYYTATDRLGNTVEFTRKITATGVEIDFDDVTVDLNESEKTLDLKGADLVGVYDSEGNVYNKVYAENGKAYHLNSIGEKLGVGEHTITIVSINGYGDIRLTLTDNQALEYVYDYADETRGINNYIWAVGEAITYPEVINKKGSYQKFDVEYAVYKGKDKVEQLSSYDEIGEYTYEAKITHKGETTTLKNTFYIVSEEEKINYSFSTMSNQFVNAWYPFEDKGRTLNYAGEITDSQGTTYNAVEFYNSNTIVRGEARMLRFNTGILEDIMNTGSKTVTMDILLKDTWNHNVYAFLMLSSNGNWDCSANAQWKLSSEKWTTVTFNLESCWVRNIKPFYSVDFYGIHKIDYWKDVGLIIDPFVDYTKIYEGARDNCTAYIANVRFGETKTVEEKTYYSFTGKAGDNLVVTKTGITVVVDGVTETLDNVYVTEYGAIKTVVEGVLPLAYPTIGQIDGDVFKYKGRNYISLTYESGSILALGKVEMQEYGKILKSYGCETKYEVYQLRTGVKVKTLSPLDMFMNFVTPGGYNLKLTVTRGDMTTTFDNYLYVKSVNDFLDNLVVKDTSRLLYAGREYVNGAYRDAFKLEYKKGNTDNHRIIEFTEEYVAKMKTSGVSRLTVYIKTATNNAPRQVNVHRAAGGLPTITGPNNSIVFGQDYVQVLEDNKYHAVTFNYTEAMFGGTFGFTLTKDSYFYIEEPIKEKAEDCYKDGNDYGLDDIY